MYVPKQFAENDRAVLHALIREKPLGTWVTQAGGELIVNHIPFLIDPHRGEHGTLIGHVARNNPVWTTIAGVLSSVVVFQGPQAYISPSWYPSKQVDGKVVPTWNYAVVHAHGVPRVVEDSAGLLDILARLTDAHEAARAAPWGVGDAPPDFIAKLLPAIVGIEIPLTELTGKWKVSQNRAAADREGTIAGLQASGDAEAGQMASLIAQFGS